MNRQHKALVLRLSSLGDVVLCSAFVKKWAELYPSGKMQFATLEAYSPILKSFPQPLEVISLKKRSPWNFFWEGWAHVELNSNIHFDLYDLQGNLKSFAFLKGLQLHFFLLHGKWVSIKKTQRHSWLRYLSVLLKKDLLGERKIYLEHQKLLTTKNFFEPELQSERLGASPVASRSGILLAPDSQHWKKKIPPSMCEDILLEVLSTSFEKITLVGPENYLEASLLKNWEEKYPGRIKNLLGQTALENLPQVASLHKLCICGNSAWLHISEAVGTPVLSFAGPIVEGFGFSPWRSQSEELSLPLKCRPCTRHGGGACSLPGDNYHSCMKRIDWKPRLKEFLTVSL